MVNVEVLTTVFIPKEEGAGYHSIQFYCRRCGEELHGTRNFDVYPPYIELECYSCGWVPEDQLEAAYELTAAWDELWRQKNDHCDL